MKEYWAVAALVASVVANVPYIFDILRRKAKPERISWLLWTMLGSTYFFSAVFSDGATYFTLGEVIGPIMIFLLSLKFGVGGKSRFDLVSMAIALVAFGLLFVFESVLVGLVLAMSIDFIAATLTTRKLLIDPTSESVGFWLFGVISSALALASLKIYNLETVLFPLYVLLFSGLVLSIIWFYKPSGRLRKENLERL